MNPVGLVFHGDRGERSESLTVGGVHVARPHFEVVEQAAIEISGSPPSWASGGRKCNAVLTGATFDTERGVGVSGVQFRLGVVGDVARREGSW